MLQTPNIFKAKAQPIPGAIPPSNAPNAVRPTSVTATFPQKKTPSSVVEFVPYAEDAGEKKEFWKAVIITFVVFAGISALIAGVVISKKLSEPAAAQALVPTYIDASPNLNGSTKTKSNTLSRVSADSDSVTATPRASAGSNRVTVRPTPQFPGGKPTTTVSRSSPIYSPTSGTPTPTPSTSGAIVTTTTTITVTNTITTTPTMTTTSTPTPTPDIYLSVEATSNQLVFGATTIGSAPFEQSFTIFNVGTTSLTLSSLKFAIDGTTNAYTINATSGNGCIANTNLPLTLTSGQSKCVNIKFEPTLSTNGSNVLQVMWNDVNIQNVAIVGVAVTATVTPTPTVTPTLTPVPAP